MSTLKLYYFGLFRAEVNGKPITNFRTDKTAALLAYLALERETPFPRAQLRTLLWDGYTVSAAQLSLRVALTNLRQVLHPLQPVQSSHKQIQWDDTGITIWSDVQALEALIVTPPTQLSAQQVADLLAHYNREFLSSWETIDSPAWQSWLQQRRSHYQNLVAMLERPLTRLPDRTALRRRHNLPRQPTPRFGHRREQEALCSYLLAPEHTLITLIGEGGVGKTRLALAVAWSFIETDAAHVLESPFADGIWFVSLSELTPTTNLGDELASAIGVACALTFTAHTALTQQLITWLQNKSLLLILDTFEHLIAAHQWLERLLQMAPRVKILITSRQQLPLPAATIMAVHALAIPPVGQEMSVEQLFTYPSIQLFVERAQRIRPSFRLQPTNSATITQICQLMAGLPLGIELAASMVLHYAPEQILAHLTVDALKPQFQWVDIPRRHQNIETVLNHTWRLLRDEEAAIVSQLAVIKGEFTQEAAWNIARAEPATLLALVDKFLLRRQAGKEQMAMMHDLVHTYALQQLEQQPLQATAARQRHAAYYLAMVEQAAPHLPNTLLGRKQLLAELANLRAAWSWSVAHHEVGRWAAALDGLTWFYRLVGFYLEGIAALQAAATALQTQKEASPATDGAVQRQHQALLARLFAYSAEFCRYSGQQDKSEQLLTRALPWSEQSGDLVSRTLIYYEKARLAQLHGDFTTMLDLAQQAYAWAEQSGDPHLVLFSLYSLHIVHYYRNDFPAFFAVTGELEQTLQQTPNRYIQNMAMGNLGYVYGRQYHYMKALHTLHQAVMGNWRLNHQQSVRHVYVHLGELFYELGAFATAQALYTQSLRYFQQSQNFFWVVLAQKGLGCSAYAAGDFAAARVYFTTAHLLTKQHAMSYLEHLVLIDLGYTLATLGNKDAITCYQRAIDLGEQGHWHNSLGAAYAALAKLALAQKDEATARAAVEKALTGLAQERTGISEPFRGRWHCYEVLQALGDPRAKAILEQSYADLMTIANGLTDPRLRQSFLENVTVNRSLAAAGRAVALA